MFYQKGYFRQWLAIGIGLIKKRKDAGESADNQHLPFTQFNLILIQSALG
jgi:hypothetical protein